MRDSRWFVPSSNIMQQTSRAHIKVWKNHRWSSIPVHKTVVLRFLNSRNARIAWDKWSYYSFKIFSCFWLVKTIRIIHHNQLLFTKFGKNLRHIASMTSKVEPTENYWTNGVKIFAILNQWRQKYSPPEIIESLTEKTWGQGCVIFGERKNKERNGQTPLRRRKYFE